MRTEILFPDNVHFGNFVEDIGQIEARGANRFAIHAGGGKQDVELTKALLHLGGGTARHGPGFSIGDARDDRFEHAAVVNHGGTDGKFEIGIDELHEVNRETRTISFRLMASNDITQISWSSAERGAKWLLHLLQPDGSFLGGTDLRAYYKTPAALLASGHTVEAHRVMDHIESRYLREGGDLDGAGVPWIDVYRTYPHSWIAVAAMMGGRFELARELTRYIATHHNAASGGFYADAAHTIEEVMTTSMAGLACLWAGQVDLGLAAAGWLEKLYANQPDLRAGLYTSWRNGLVTDQQDPGSFVDAGKTRQYYFQYGISAAFLTSAAGVTGDGKWLSLAKLFLRASEFAGPDRYQTPQSGKIGWGAAWTHRMTKAPEDRALVEAVMRGLAALQNDDGSWLVTGVYGGASAEADSATIDITSEFVALQSFMAQVGNAESI
jgi:hypothetical protein